MFFLLYRHTDHGVFDDFSQDFRKFYKIWAKVTRALPNIFGKFSKITEDFRRLPKIVKDFQGRPEDVSIIHQRI